MREREKSFTILYCIMCSLLVVTYSLTLRSLELSSFFALCVAAYARLFGACKRRFLFVK